MLARALQFVYDLLGCVHRGAAWLVDRAWRAGGWLWGQARPGLWVALGLAMLGFLAGAGGLWSAHWFIAQARSVWLLEGKPIELLEQMAGQGEWWHWRLAGFTVEALCCLAVPLVLVGRRWAWWAAMVAWSGFAALWLWAFRLVVHIPARLYGFDAQLYDSATRNDHWVLLGTVWLAGLLLGAAVLVVLHRDRTRRAYRWPAGPVSWADRLLAWLRSGGSDPQFSSSCWWAMLLMLLMLVGPTALRSCGMEEPYGLIKGKGQPTVAVVRVKKKKKPKRKKYIVNAWSPYIFKQPKLEDSQVLEELEQETSDTYVAQAGQSGGLGRGGKGPGGWPKGLENARIRFIRLKYAGGDWDQDMGKGADYNLLLRFHQITKFRIADNTEAIEIARLRRFPKHYAPPFVFLTGRGAVNFTASEIKTLRWYCLEEGGCLFIDNGGGTFHSHIVRQLKRIFPDKSLVVIANDDPIFKAPFLFPNGAPPLWHHAGHRAMGIKHNGRWVVFYHPGDINDAWKDGHSGASPEVAEQAYRLGINVMYYTFNQYYRIHFEQ